MINTKTNKQKPLRVIGNCSKCIQKRKEHLFKNIYLLKIARACGTWTTTFTLSSKSTFTLKEPQDYGAFCVFRSQSLCIKFHWEDRSPSSLTSLLWVVNVVFLLTVSERPGALPLYPALPYRMDHLHRTNNQVHQVCRIQDKNTNIHWVSVHCNELSEDKIKEYNSIYSGF